MKKSIQLFLSALLLVIGCGCAGSKFSFDDARRVKPGMSTSEVQAIMGRPYRVTSRNGVEIWIWSYANGMTGAHQSVSFVFRNNVLESVPKIPDSFD